MPTVSGINKYSRFRLSSHRGRYIRGGTGAAICSRMRASLAPPPLMPAFLWSFLFQVKRKRKKNNYNICPYTSDRGSVISSPLTQTKQITTSPFQLLLTAQRDLTFSFKNNIHLQTARPRQRGTYHITRTYKIGFSEVLRKPRRPPSCFA